MSALPNLAGPGGLLERCLGLPAIDPGFLLLASELLEPDCYLGGYSPKAYEATTAASDPEAYRRLAVGWGKLTAVLPHRPGDEEFGLRVALCAKARNSHLEDFAAGRALSRGQLESECRLVRTRDGSEMVLLRLIERKLRELYGAPTHPYFIAAERGSLAQLQAVSDWCAPPEGAIEDAAARCIIGSDAAKALWALSRVRSASPSMLAALNVSFMRARQNQARGNPTEFDAIVVSAIFEFLFLRIDAERARELIAVSEETEREIALRAFFEEYPEDLMVKYTWGGLVRFLWQIAGLGLRVAWLGAVARAPRRPAGPW
jgi:hypothetical protein